MDVIRPSQKLLLQKLPEQLQHSSSFHEQPRADNSISIHYQLPSQDVLFSLLEFASILALLDSRGPEGHQAYYLV